MGQAVQAKKVAALVIHGMGGQEPDFSDAFRQKVLKRVDKLGYQSSAITMVALYWADVTEPRQKRFYDDAKVPGPGWVKGIRAFVASAFGDATAYQRVTGGGAFERIHARVRDTVALLYDDIGRQELPLVVVAHSLGGHIMSRYIRGLQGNDINLGPLAASPFERFETHAGMLTFGCNIPLFEFAYDAVTPIAFPGGSLEEAVKVAAKWLNFYDKHDVLGWPLKPLSPSYDAVVDADIRIGVGGGLSGWNPKSHSEYWDDDDFIDEVADYLRKVLVAAGVQPVGPTRTVAQLRAARAATKRRRQLKARTRTQRPRAPTRRASSKVRAARVAPKRSKAR